MKFFRGKENLLDSSHTPCGRREECCSPRQQRQNLKCDTVFSKDEGRGEEEERKEEEKEKGGEGVGEGSDGGSGRRRWM